MGSTKSKQLLVQMCSSVNDLNHLLELGCLLGISEWTNVITPKCRLPDVAVQLLPPEIEEFMESGSQVSYFPFRTTTTTMKLVSNSKYDNNYFI